MVCILSKTHLMKRFYFPTFLLLSLSFLLAGCNFGEAAEEAMTYADKFHEHMKNGNEQGMIDMIHEDAMSADGDDFKALIYSLDQLGKVKKVKKEMGFNTQITNGVTTVTLNYTIEFEDRTMKEEIVFRDADDGSMKVIRLHLI